MMLFTSLSFAVAALTATTVICATVPTHQYDNESGNVTQNLETRKGGKGGIDEIVDFAVEAIQGLIGAIQQDKEDRSQFTQALVSEMNKQDSSHNYVVCHTKHETHWDGQQGADWNHTHKEFDIKIGGTIGYEIYSAESGQFIREGDGGYLNWAYVGNVVKNEDDGKKLTFAAP
ncbi:hypothetical protein D9758_009858 [Tetrapyrgos nigripes]|uniref:DUF7888 domain-containing protein n=1 Tax=Tetrapyrgos nigripes TaxID=182062 RepID=A0A8H5GMI9_9AGAR|nr:hypothetical protein D9758_009858 [Tetrapyrgos nigripes]